MERTVLARPRLSTRSLVALRTKASLPAPEPNDVMRILSPGPAGLERELPVGHVEDGEAEIRGHQARLLQDAARRGEDVLEVGRLSREASPVARIELPLAAPEVGRVGGVAERLEDLGERILRAEEIRGPARRRGELQGVIGGALGRVRADPEGVLHAARL